MENNTPERKNFTELKPFRLWCQKVLPLVYDDSLTYYELLCKVVDYLNKTMEDVEVLEDDTTGMYTAYGQLQDYVNNYFDNLDITDEINAKLDTMAEDGSLTELISAYVDPLISAQNTEIQQFKTSVNSRLGEQDSYNAETRATIANMVSTPLTANTASAMTDTTKVYVYTGTTSGNYTNGHWYYYNGSSWADGGVYNSVALETDKTLAVSDMAADAKVVGDNLTSLKSDLSNLEYSITPGEHTLSPIWESGTIDSSGEEAPTRQRIRTGFISLRAAEYMTLTPASGYKCAVEKYDVDKSFLGEMAFSTNARTLTSETATYIRLLLGDTNNSIVDTAIATNLTITFKSTIVSDMETVTEAVNNLNPVSERYPGTVNQYWDSTRQAWTTSSVRLTTKTPLYVNNPIIINVKTGYRFGIYKFSDGSSAVPLALPTWQTEPYFVNQGEWIALLLAKTDNTSISPNEIVNCYSYCISGNTGSTDIVSLNPDAYPSLLQAKRPINSNPNGYLSVAQPVILLHFSDIHGDAIELQRIVDFRNEYIDLIDDTICTGDIVEYRYSNGITFWDSVNGSDDILLAVGNHDVLAAESGWDWTQRVSQSDQYSRYFEPYITNWNVTYSTGKTYYYKDYTAKGVRLIVVNCMLENTDDAAQLQWFTNALSDAKNNNLAVCVATHYMLSSPQKVASNFTSIDKSVGSEFLNADYMTAVNNFINNGGSFICYIAGHTHSDIIVRSTAHSNQYCVVIDALSRAQSNQYSDTQRTDNTKSQDLANLFVIDTASHVIKIIRIGANMDHYLRDKNHITINYLTGEIVAQA